MDFVELIFIAYKCSPKTSFNALVSATSPRGVEVPCILTASTSVMTTPASAIQFSITLVAPSPSGCGAVMWCASAERPPPATSAYMVAPRACACSRLSKTNAPAPSPITKPSRSLSKGREAVFGSSFRTDKACIALNPPILALATPASEPPVTMTSA